VYLYSFSIRHGSGQIHPKPYQRLAGGWSAGGCVFGS